VRWLDPESDPSLIFLTYPGFVIIFERELINVLICTFSCITNNFATDAKITIGIVRVLDGHCHIWTGFHITVFGTSFICVNQDVFTVTGMPAKVDAQIRGLGAGFLPTCLAQPYIDTGRLVVRRVERPEQQLQFSYAWRASGQPGQGRALQWWLDKLKRRVTRGALLGKHAGASAG